jgi:hypothetical protein
MATTPARIDELAEELAALSPEDRRRVLVAVGRRGPISADASKKASAWQRLHGLESLVSLGGDALDDCSHLYDG